MRILLVEDDAEIVSVFQVEAAGSGDELVVAGTRDEALDGLEGTFFDLVVCDLRLPSAPGALDEDVAHGRAVLTRVLDRLPGTPIIGFSAFGSVALMQQLLQRATQADFLGEGQGQERQMLTFFTKDELPDCVALVREISQSIQALDEIEIASGLSAIELTPEQDRVLRLYARRLNATVVRLQVLSDGLSGARVLRLRLEAGGAHVASVVAKLDDIQKVRDENDRVERLVAPVLVTGAYPSAVTLVAAGAGSLGGLFYRLADGFERSLLELLEAGGDMRPVVHRIRGLLAPWHEGAPVVRTSLADVRLVLVDEADIPADYLADVQVPAITFDASRCSSHGDLHVLNVLVSHDGTPMIIDFSEVATMPAAVDPVTLELSPIFHPSAAATVGAWPSEQQAEQWDDLGVYLDECPFPEFVTACRDWAFDVAAGDREVYSAVFAFAARQLKYPTTRHEVALGLIRCTRRRLGI